MSRRIGYIPSGGYFDTPQYKPVFYGTRATVKVAPTSYIDSLHIRRGNLYGCPCFTVALAL